MNDFTLQAIHHSPPHRSCICNCKGGASHFGIKCYCERDTFNSTTLEKTGCVKRLASRPSLFAPRLWART